MKRSIVLFCVLCLSCLAYSQDRTKVLIADFVASVQDHTTSEACATVFRSNFSSNMKWELVPEHRLAIELARNGEDISSVNDGRLADLGSVAGADNLIVGELRVEGDQYVLEVRVIDVPAKKIKGLNTASWKKGTPFRKPVTELSDAMKPYVTMPVNDSMKTVGGVEAVSQEAVTVSSAQVMASSVEQEKIQQELPKKVLPSGLLLNGYTDCSKVDLDPAGGEWAIKVTLKEGSMEDCILSPPTSWYKAVLADDGLLTLTFTPNHGDLRKGTITITAGEESGDFVFIQAGLPNPIEENVWAAKLSRLLGNPSATYENGSYRGGLVEYPKPDTRTGAGLYRWSDGTVYMGSWKENKKVGKGMYATPKGLMFAQLAGCRIIVGDFVNDIPRGNMRCYDRHGNLLYDGPVFDWAPEKVYPSKGMKSLYTFCYVEYDDGSCYIGEMLKGVKDGFGLFIDSSGRPWMGMWKSDSKAGGNFF